MPKNLSDVPSNSPIVARASRLDLSFPVEFRQGDVRTRGSCQEISESGILARFRADVEVWIERDLWCDMGIMVLELRVRTGRANDRDVGMIFQFRNERERAAVRSVVAFAATRTGLIMRPPF